MTNKKTVTKTLASYDRQIRKGMGFWIKHRPSRWGYFLPERFLRPLLKFMKTKGVKKLILIFAFIFSLIFVGVIPTLSFIWSNIFRLWLILLFIPLIYWTLAITSVYTRVVAHGVYEFIRAFLVDS
ncbi:hypothetical protein [Prochlorococcus marinus]|uniref:hypothetical protein n=1 Tax=Prochlorococcus marinus TaxID=1219 RepID=UPI0022B56963|nr:hypothetical protein [Prochlorococcus marinus]